MAGLGRIQQRFNAAVVMVLTLAGFGGLAGESGARKAAAGGGQPIARKYIKSSNPRSNTPGMRYQGYCSGRRETARRAARMNPNDNLLAMSYLETFEV